MVGYIVPAPLADAKAPYVDGLPACPVIGKFG